MVGTKTEKKKDVSVPEPEPMMEPDLHPAAVTWNAVLDAFEALRQAWTKHQDIWRMNRQTVLQRPMYEQQQLGGILHQQRLFFAMEYFSRYLDRGFEQLRIKEKGGK